MEFDKSVETSVRLGFKMTLVSPLLTFLLSCSVEASRHIVKTYGETLMTRNGGKSLANGHLGREALS